MMMGKKAKRLVDELLADGIQAAMQYALPVTRRIRFALPEDQMEREVASLRRELDETRAALRLQTARCRQLVAAYSERLRAGDALRDHQLALVLRALVALEARLRREQKAIRAQLTQRDAVIHQQQAEISRLRSAATTTATTTTQPTRTAPTPRPAAGTTPSQLIVVNHTCGQDCDQDVAREDELQAKRSPSSRKAARTHAAHAHETVVDASHLRHQEATLRVLELVGPDATQIPLLNGETACVVDAGIEPPADFIEDAVTPPPDVVASYNDMNRECLELASMAASLRAEKSPMFQDNPVLECVNLILLRDQEDLVEEGRGKSRSQGRGQSRGQGRPRHVEEAVEPQAWYDTKPRRPTPPALPPKPSRLVATRPPNGLKSRSPTATPSPSSSPSASPSASPSETMCNGSASTASKRTSAADTVDGAARGAADAKPVKEAHAANGTCDASEALRRNFEEFNLDDCEIEGLGEPEGQAEGQAEDHAEGHSEGRPDGDGAESKLNGVAAQDILALTAPAEAPAATYDSFLEVTGLSNKSILTPSRMLSNHRSVLKPKDVKHRSRVKAEERCLTSHGPTVKYWTEPFL